MSRLPALRSGEPDADLGLLRLLQLFDSQFPVGAFAHSGGLETYAARGGSLPEVRQVLRAQINLGWGRSELAAAWLAWHAAAEPNGAAELDRLGVTLDAMKVVPATRDMSLGLGRRTLNLLRRLHPDRLPALSHPHHAIVIGVAGHCLELEPRAVLLAFAQNLASGILASAVRCMPIAPADAQALLVEVQPQLGAAVARAIDDPEGCLFTCTPALDLRSHQQASLHTRLFQS
jgi:urease accessory protein